MTDPHINLRTQLVGLPELHLSQKELRISRNKISYVSPFFFFFITKQYFQEDYLYISEKDTEAGSGSGSLSSCRFGVKHLRQLLRLRCTELIMAPGWAT